MKKIFILILIAVVIIGGFSFWFYQSKTKSIATKEITINPKNCTYVIDGQNITLKNGYSEEDVVSGSASKLITEYFGNEVVADFNGDGIKDTAFLLTQSSGGSGTFYYAAAALSSKDGCIGTNAVLLGDRIDPQTTEFNDGEIIINYADRKPNEPMAATPSVGVSKYLKINDGKLVEIIKTSIGEVTRKVGEKEFNFLIQKINADSVDGLWYILYPVAMLQGQAKTLQAGDTIGYACEGKTAILSSINVATQTVMFSETIKNAPPGGCPI
jgi:hypothetical protein